MGMAAKVGAAALLDLVLAAVAPAPLVPIVLWVAGCTGAVAAAMAIGWPGLLGKRPDGSIPWWSYVVFWPWHGLVRVVAAANRANEPPRHEVAPGWWLGGWPSTAASFTQWPAVLDLTNELPRTAPPGTPYLNVPAWDGTVVPPDRIEAAAAWAVAQRARGPVLVHCAAGHSRSAVALAAAFVRAGASSDPEDALATLKRTRATVRPTRAQRAALEAWARQQPHSS